MDMIQEIQELKRKAELYNVIKQNIDNAKANIDIAIDQLNQAMNSLEPTRIIKEKRIIKNGPTTSTRNEISEALDEQYNKMKSGLYVSKKTIVKDYPEWDDKRVHNFIQNKIKQIPKIQSRYIEGSNRSREYFLDNTP